MASDYGAMTTQICNTVDHCSGSKPLTRAQRLTLSGAVAIYLDKEFKLGIEKGRQAMFDEMLKAREATYRRSLRKD
jgi:hypothetical protein